MAEFPNYDDVADYLEGLLVEEMLDAVEGDNPAYFREQLLLGGFLMVDAKFIPITEGPDELL